MKYNLRFYWKNPYRDNQNFEDYGHAYIRTMSNIPCYQLDRNKLEGELLRLNRTAENFEFVAPIKGLDVSLSDTGPHTVGFKSPEEILDALQQYNDSKPAGPIELPDGRTMVLHDGEATPIFQERNEA